MLVVLFCLVMEVNVRDVRGGSLEEVGLVKRWEIKDFCTRGPTLLSSVGSSGADIVVVQLADTRGRWCNTRRLCGRSPLLQ